MEAARTMLEELASERGVRDECLVDLTGFQPFMEAIIEASS
jgi:hypothetical protein